MIDQLMIALGSAAACTAAAVLFGEDVQMPVPPISVTGTTETLVVVGGKVSTPNPNGKAVVRCWCEIQTGTGTTDITLTVYSGPAIGGRLIGTKVADFGEFTAGAKATFEIEFIDPFSNVSDVQYCMSIMQTAATADGKVMNALLDTKVLSG
jgi:hypothetical protein